MLQIIFSWLKAKAEELLAEQQAGFRPGQNMVKQISNSWVITEKHPQHQHDSFHNTASKTIFGRVWHAGLLQVLKSFYIEEELFHANQASGMRTPLQWSPLEQLATGILQDNSRSPSEMLTFTHSVQLVPREDHAGNTPWIPHIHLHWWQAHTQPVSQMTLPLRAALAVNFEMLLTEAYEKQRRMEW